MTFGEKLFMYRKRAQLSQSELCDIIGISRQTLFKWEQGYNFPSLCKVHALCLALDCDADDLLVSEYFNDASVYSVALPGKVSSRSVANNIKVLRESRKLTQKELCDALHVTRQTVSRWEHARIAPDTANISALGAFFDVSVHELLHPKKPAYN